MAEQQACVDIYNVFSSESVLILDAADPSAGAAAGAGPSGAGLQGSVAVDASLPAAEAAAAAKDEAMREVTPDNTRVAIVLEAADDGGRGAAIEAWLRGPGGCGAVHRAPRSAFGARYPFLMGSDLRDDGHLLYPSEILPGQLFLGPAASVHPRVLDELGITHVVSVFDHRLSAERVAGRAHLDFSRLGSAIEDSEDTVRHPPAPP